MKDFDDFTRCSVFTLTLCLSASVLYAGLIGGSVTGPLVVFTVISAFGICFVEMVREITASIVECEDKDEGEDDDHENYPGDGCCQG